MKRVLFPALVLFSSAPLPAAELLPAAEVVTDLEKSGQNPGEGDQNSAEALKTKIEAFSATSPSLSPQEAAKGWLELFQDWRQLNPAEQRRSPDPRESGFPALVRALPPPAAWEALQKEIASAPVKDILLDELLALFSATLNEDSASQMKAFTAISKLAGGDFSGSPSLEAVKKVMGEYAGKAVSAVTSQLAQPLAKLSDDPAQVRAYLEMQLKAMADLEEGYRASLDLPGIAALGGEEKATEVIKKVLASGATLQSGDADLLSVARKLVLKNPSELKSPQWGLIDGISEENMRLYRILEKKFPKDEESEYEKRQAGAYYFMSLIIGGKSDAAYAWVTSLKDRNEASLPYDELDPSDFQGKGKVVLDFLFHSLAKDPTLPFWNDLISLAAHENRSGEALDLVRNSSQSKKLDASTRSALQALLVTAALADGAVDEAAAIMREQIALKKEGEQETQDALRAAERLARLGELLKRDDLREEGIREALAITSVPSETFSPSNNFLELLVQTGRAEDVQSRILAAMKLRMSRDPGYRAIDLTAPLVNLAGLYDQAGRPNEVLKLLADAPWWKSKDLAGIINESDFRGVTIGEMAARAFAANNDKPKAIETLKETLRAAPSKDRVYQMLIELEGQNAIAFLDEQFAGDQFQERPLIWKAVLQLQAGQTAEAEKSIRQAVAIDPSDGEMGADDRMRAYAVLADILEKTGKEADAKVYRGAVEAVRLAEHADEYFQAGLLSQAITMYEKALTYFADAYCIQSRLAVQLAAQGKTKEAEEHYRRAYELMPDSFGRMESHCFGCERAFDGEMAETLAEKTFRKMIEENPAKPQLYYLMGYLRSEQNKPAEALTYFQKAVELDPDYINAWKKILSLDGAVLLPNKARDEAALAILRLQPNTSLSSLREVTDLKKLWTLVEQLQREHPPKKPRDLFRLEAAAAAREELERKPAGYGMAFAPNFLPDLREGLASPGAVLNNQILIQQISEVLNQFSHRPR